MRITLPTGTPAELAQPQGAAKAGLVVFPDIFGLRPLFDDLCARLAAERQLAVCAIEPFPGQALASIDERFAAVPQLVDGKIFDDLEAAATATGAERVGLIGFCLGGMYTLKAASIRRFNRCVAFYGMIRLPPAWRGEGQSEPLQYVTRTGATPTLAICGGKDPYTPPEDIDALRAAGVAVHVYAEAEHGFVHDAERPAHRPADAADAWQRAYAFLEM